MPAPIVIAKATLGCVVVAWCFREFGGLAALSVGFAGSFLGVFPPIFSVLYGFYTSRFGRHLIPMMHPRVPPHTTTVTGARRLVAAGPCGICCIPVPVQPDNYAYIFVCERTGASAVVDPGHPSRIRAVMKHIAASAPGAKLTHILTTHKHWDHAGGNEELVARQAADGTSTVVVGSAVDSPAATTVFVRDGDSVDVGDARVTVLEAPGHTAGHVMFHVVHQPRGADADKVEVTSGAIDMKLGECGPLFRNAAPRPVASFTGHVPEVRSGALFTGDALFCGGYGAMFETPTAEPVLQTQRALLGIAARDEGTLVYPGHEYTARMFDELRPRFKVSQRSSQCPSEVATKAFQLRDSEVQSATSRGCCTVPSTLHTERLTNPFLTVPPETLERLMQQGASATAIDAAVFSSYHK